MSGTKARLASLNGGGQEAFVAVCGPCFEASAWIAERTWERRPFASLEILHQELVSTVERAAEDEQVALIKAHPDLVGRLAREGLLTAESTREQAEAGLDRLSPDEAAVFERYNHEYRERFGFPFVICARENRKEAILAAFPQRLAHSRGQEIDQALVEIAKIARLRLLDAVRED